MTGPATRSMTCLVNRDVTLQGLHLSKPAYTGHTGETGAEDPTARAYVHEDAALAAICVFVVCLFALLVAEVATYAFAKTV